MELKRRRFDNNRNSFIFIFSAITINSIGEFLVYVSVIYIYIYIYIFKRFVFMQIKKINRIQRRSRNVRKVFR